MGAGGALDLARAIGTTGSARQADVLPSHALGAVFGAARRGGLQVGNLGAAGGLATPVGRDVHIDGALELAAILQSHSRGGDVALDGSGALQDDLLLAIEVALDLSFHVDDPGIDGGVDPSVLADRHQILGEGYRTFHPALHDQVLVTGEISAYADGRADGGGSLRAGPRRRLVPAHRRILIGVVRVWSLVEHATSSHRKGRFDFRASLQL